MLRKIFANQASVNVAINGFGRIGRATFKVLLENPRVNVVAINDLTDAATLAHLLQYDSAYGKYAQSVRAQGKAIIIAKKSYPIFSIREPENLPWQKLKVDVVLECTGIFRDLDGASSHVKAGAKKVIISAPGKGDGIKTIVKGVNEEKINKQDKVISMASCTTNALAPISAVINSVFGVQKAIMTTVHSYTADQNLVDGPHKDIRRARAAAVNIVPTTTGAALAVAKTIPALEGKFDGMAMRVPVITGSIVDAVYLLKKKTDEQKINTVLSKAASSHKLQGILTVTKEPLVSSDIIGNPYSSIVDLNLTKVIDKDLVKIVAWYDNEWGYSNRLAEMADYFGRI